MIIVVVEWRWCYCHCAVLSGGLVLEDILGARRPLPGAEDALGVFGINHFTLLEQVGQLMMPFLVHGENFTRTLVLVVDDGLHLIA